MKVYIFIKFTLEAQLSYVRLIRIYIKNTLSLSQNNTKMSAASKCDKYRLI